jgi:general secretion pathway protein A
MYEAFYGLNEKPFNLTPDPAFFYFSQTHKSAYSHLKYAVSENKGFVVITGEIGSGKTTLIKYLLKNTGVDVNIGLINNTHLFPHHMLKLICKEFELRLDKIDMVDLQEVFYGFLLNEYAHRRRVVLIIDEAQHLTPKSLEEIRLLSNLESDKNHLLQIILIGQPGLKDVLNQKGLEQFTQRVTVTYHLGRLTMNEATEYINFRLQKAGARNGSLFTPEAVQAVYQHSTGTPRIINILCDTALLYGFADEQKVITENLIATVVNDRKKSGIYDENRKTLLGRESVTIQVEKPFRTEMETRIALIEKQLAIIDSQLVKIDQNFDDQMTKISQNLENIARRDGLELEMLKILKENIRSRVKMARTYMAASSIKDKKPAGRWRSFFGK